MPESVNCIVSAGISQNNMRFGKSRNVQCVCMSVCACTYVQCISRTNFNTGILNTIVMNGDAYYNQTKLLLGPRHKHAYLNANDVGPVVNFDGGTFNVEVEWINNGVYATSVQNMERSKIELSGIIRRAFEVDEVAGYVFNGLSSAVSFWSTDNSFYVFNSHSVNSQGNIDSNGVARLFVLNSVEALSGFLLKNTPFAVNHNEYEVSRVICRPALDERQLVTMEVVDQDSHTVMVTAPNKKGKKRGICKDGESVYSQLNDPKLIARPVVILKDIGVFESRPAECKKPKRKPGRPKKKKVGRPSKNPKVISRPVDKIEDTDVLESTPSECKKPKRKPGRPKEVGRPKTSTKSREEQQREATERYNEQHPDIHQGAAAKYQEEHPEVNQGAVDRYSQQHPDVNKGSVGRYKENNSGPHLPTPLRKGGLISEYFGSELNKIKVYKLKNISLQSPEVHRCQHCRARLFEEEKTRKQWCCGSGRYNVMDLPPLDHPLYRNALFLQHPRLYNDLFSFCALSVPQGYHHPRGLSFMKIQGRVYHKVFDLSCEGPNNSFMYIDDGESRLRQGSKLQLDPAVIHEIQNYLESRNPYITEYKKLNDEQSEDAHLVFELTSRRKDGPVLGDRPQSTEVSVVLSCDTTPPTNKFCIWKRGFSEPRLIGRSHFLIEPFTYPLLYPDGTHGWHIGRVDNTNSKMSQQRYVRCLLLSEDRFSKFGRLSETWLVDMFARLEGERLGFIQLMQRKAQQKGGLRSAPAEEILSNLKDIKADETIQGDGAIVPGRIYLPHTFTGGPRYMRVAYMDSMALVSRKGGPSFFLTFTAFGGWEEILKSKYPKSKQEAHLCNRVFQIKLLELLRDIRCGKFFGKLTYVIWVVEFQMRGLPHAHICFRVENGGPTQNTDIDRVIRADIPSTAEANGRLRELVLRHHIHGPCGEPFRTDLPCWDLDFEKCTKFFPKPLTEVTYTDSRGFVNYKRNSENKATIMFRNRSLEIDDRWVVPYNASLLLKYQCHINLEISSTRRVVKYLFKYICKGAPLRRMKVQIEQDEVDEVEDYVTKRYVGATDAAWRILEFDLTGREPTVVNIPVHLPGQHMVVFRPGDEKESVDKSTSKLIIYLSRPGGEEMDNLTYVDFFENYIIHTTKPKASRDVLVHPDGRHFITRRLRGSSVARIFWVAPARGEQYYLRMLLARYPCRSYEDLYALGGPMCTSFQVAARVMGLADDQKEYFEAIEEASKFMVAYKLRHFFVLLATIGSPASEIWSSFKRQLCEDYIEQFPDDDEKAYKKGLIQIDRSLRRQGSSLLEAGLPVVEDDSNELGRHKLEYSAKLQGEFLSEWEPKLSVDQGAVLQHVREIIAGKGNGKVIFVDGPGGYGKTLLLKIISSYIRSLDEIVLCVASSGIAANNLDGGITAHSLFRLPLENKEDGYWSITNGSQRGELIRAASVIIYDEAPMANRYLIEMVDRSLKDLMANEELFGGKIVILAGDFRQIPPVVANAKTITDIERASILSSYLWNYIKVFSLTSSHRLVGEERYGRFLIDLGGNLIEQRSIGEGKDINLLVGLPMIKTVENVNELVRFVYPPEVVNCSDVCAKRAIISTHNSNVKEINEIVMDALDGELHSLYSLDSVVEDEGSDFNVDSSLLHHSEGKGAPSHILKLKIGCVCMVTRNLNFDLGLVNGSKVIIVGITRRIITVRKPGSAELFAIPRITFKFPIYNNSPIEMYRRQFPLALSYCITIHKSQGQTIDVVGLDLRSDCFTHGQLYVALSRVRTTRNLRLLVPAQRIIDGVAYTKNVVFMKLLQTYICPDNKTIQQTPDEKRIIKC